MFNKGGVKNKIARDTSRKKERKYAEMNEKGKAKRNAHEKVGVCKGKCLVPSSSV